MRGVSPVMAEVLALALILARVEAPGKWNRWTRRGTQLRLEYAEEVKE